jgi:transposase
LKKLKTQQKKQHPEIVKGAHLNAVVQPLSPHPLLKNQENLTDTQQEKLKQVYENCPTLKMAHRLKECLRHIFECSSTKEKAIRRLQRWCRIAEQEHLFPTFRKTLARWIDKIANYFHQRTTSGMVEGINNKVKLIKRRAFGFRNFSNFRLRVIAAFL